MVYQCAQCRAPLPTGAAACPRCGQAFNVPVPPSQPPNVLMPSLSPQSAAPRRRNIGLWIAGGIALVLLVFAGLGLIAYHAVQNMAGASLSRALAGREAPAGQQGSWAPPANLVAHLAPPVRFGGPLGFYTVQPPAGFALGVAKMDAADGKSVIYTWSGPAAPDGTAAQFVVSLGSDGGMMTSHLTPAQDVQLGFLSMQRNHTQVACSAIQSGSLNGQTFARGYWKGVGPRTGRLFHGLVYCQIASPNMINMAGKDSEPSSRTMMPVLDAAALTLRLVQKME